MPDALIIEDEKPGMQMLIKTSPQVSAEVNMKAKLSSVKETTEYVTCHPEANIISNDVQLPDGLSFVIFNKAGNVIPLIFKIDYDRYTMVAIEKNGTGYCVKPIDKARPRKALFLSYDELQTHFHNTMGNASVVNVGGFINNRKKTRLLVRRGLENIALRLEDIVLFYAHNKLVYAIDQSAKKYISDKTLSALEEELDKTIFFRVNRQYIVSINYIRSFKPHEKVKLLIDTTIPEINHSIVVSQERAPVFRKWMLEA